jgi:guanylate kinase
MEVANDRPSALLAIIGPSGVGKSSLLRELHLRQEVRAWSTLTTRPPRPDERGGCLEHRFVGSEEFDRLAQEGAFVATGAIAGLPYRYGLPNLACGPGLLALVLRANAIAEVKRAFPGVLVYQVEDDLARTRRRLWARGLQPTEVAARLAGHHFELELGRRLCHRAFVNAASLPDLTDRVARALRTDLATGPSPRAALAPYPGGAP